MENNFMFLNSEFEDIYTKSKSAIIINDKRFTNGDNNVFTFPEIWNKKDWPNG